MAQPGSLVHWHWRKLSVLSKMKWESVYGESGLGHASSNISFNTAFFFSHCDGDLSRNSDHHFYFEVMYIMISWSPSEGEFKNPISQEHAKYNSWALYPVLVSPHASVFSFEKEAAMRLLWAPHILFYHYSRYLVDVQYLIFISPQFFPYWFRLLNHFCGLLEQLRDA